MNIFKSRLALPIRISQVRSFHATMTPSLRQRAVVSSFICTSPQSPTGLTFALFKRSQDVSTYRGKWAVCSGSIDATDASPELAAKREIQEETTLSDADITLLRRGKPFSLVDEKLNTEWTIHPFAWQLTPDAKPIQFDWEHTEFHFVKPEDLAKYDHVPQLEVGMQRVLVSDDTERGLLILKEDHESGAQALALKALHILLQMSRGHEMKQISNTDEFWKELRWRAWHLAKNGRPSMGAAIEAELFKALDTARSQLLAAASGGIGDLPLQTVKSIVELAIEARIESRQHNLQILAEFFVELVEGSWQVSSDGNLPSTTHIVTLSSSGTTTQCLGSLIDRAAKRGVNVKLSVLESRPKFEGVAFVNTLLEHVKDPQVLTKLQINIVSDASIATVVKDADYVVLGGDKVLPDGSVSNKIGSLPAAIMAKTLHPACKVVAVFETSKITSPSFDAGHEKIEYNDAAELMSAWSLSSVAGLKEKQKQGWQVEIKNPYFEWVPADYVDSYITEEGPLEKGAIKRLGFESEKLEKRLFGDL